MLDLYEELKALITELTNREIEYALCGGLAMAVYGAPRATIDIDLLIPREVTEQVMDIARELDYTLEAEPMTFANAAIEIRRVSKIDPDSGDLLMLDLLLVTPQIMEVWDGRQMVEWESGSLWVVSRHGLIALKTLRGSGQDLDDIKHLKAESDED